MVTAVSGFIEQVGSTLCDVGSTLCDIGSMHMINGI